MGGLLQALIIGLGGILAIAVVVIAIVFLIVPLFKGIGWLFKQVFTFIGGELTDALRTVGSVLMTLILVPLAVGSIIIGRWSATAHYGRAIQNEAKAGAMCLYRMAIGHPARLLCLTPLVDGLEKRLPEVVAAAPGRDKPRGRTSQFDGYQIVGSLPTGGSGSKLYVAEPDEMKRAGFERAGQAGVGKVVIKAFSVHDGSSLPQIVRESRALDAAKKLGLVLDHDLTPERFFYVMRYVPGESLTAVTQQLHAESGSSGLDNRRLKSALGYLGDLVRTLDGYHKGGLWHKDVKPDNIIVDGAEAHLVDFGLLSSLRSAMTLTTHGTEYFRDPEMVRMALKGMKVHEVNGAKFDIFSAGAVAFSVVENSFPAHGALSQLSKRCPDALRWVIRRAMTDYDKRYTSAGEMLADLEFLRNAADPFAIRPAELPSMRGGQAPDLEQGVPPLPNRDVGNREPFSLVWSRIVEMSGETFSTITGKPFTYSVDGNVVRTTLANQNLPRSDFEKAYSLFPLKGPGEISNTVRGSAYVWAILHDPRIASRTGGQSVGESTPSSFDRAPGAPFVMPNPNFASVGGGEPRRRPKIRVTDWWTGRYAVESGASPSTVGSSVLVGSAEVDEAIRLGARWREQLSPQKIAEYEAWSRGPVPGRGDECASHRANGWTPDQLCAIWYGLMLKGQAEGKPNGGISMAKFNRVLGGAFGSPNSVPIGGFARAESIPGPNVVAVPRVAGAARSPRVPAGDRRPAKEQLERAKARAQAARDRAHARMSGRLSARRAAPKSGNPAAMNIGAAFAAAIAVFIGVGAFFTVGRHNPKVSVAVDNHVAEAREISRDVADGVREGVSDASAAIGESMRELFGDRALAAKPAPAPVVDAPAQLLEAVGAAPDSRHGNILVVSDVFVIGSQPYVRHYINQMEVSSEALRRMGFTLSGDAAQAGALGQDEFARQVELISHARAAVGSTAKGSQEMVDALAGFADASPEIDGVVWIWPDQPNDPSRFNVAVVGPEGAEVHHADPGSFDRALATSVRDAFTPRQ
ncbi:MAG: hypothetical protein H6809_00190 [Phycisphaeraceae bacterium]|nr:hypothetical protein [Phycisphaeraceae bacterium]